MVSLQLHFSSSLLIINLLASENQPTSHLMEQDGCSQRISGCLLCQPRLALAVDGSETFAVELVFGALTPIITKSSNPPSHVPKV